MGETSMLLQFRDGDHVGEAPMEDIIEGFASGELSAGCQVYAPSTDSWQLISSFMNGKSNKDDDEEEEEEAIGAISLKDKATPDGVERLMFRDGSHSGEAPLDEIVAGLEDGELSEACEVYDAKLGVWASILSNVQDMEQPQELNRSMDSNTDPASIDALIDLCDESPLLAKNNKKKPQRGLSTWGKGVAQNLGPLIQNQSMHGSNGNGMHRSVRHPEKPKHIKPPPKLMRTVTQAMIQWDMLEDGDRLLLGLSGGKDSLSLLHILLEFQRKLPIRFDIEVRYETTVPPVSSGIILLAGLTPHSLASTRRSVP